MIFTSWRAESCHRDEINWNRIIIETDTKSFSLWECFGGASNSRLKMKSPQTKQTQQKKKFSIFLDRFSSKALFLQPSWRILCLRHKVREIARERSPVASSKCKVAMLCEQITAKKRKWLWLEMEKILYKIKLNERFPLGGAPSIKSQSCAKVSWPKLISPSLDDASKPTFIQLSDLMYPKRLDGITKP